MRAISDSTSGRGKGRSVLHRVQRSSGAHSASLLLSKYHALPGVMELEREADYSPSFIVEVKNK